MENTNSYFECASEAISNLPGLAPKSHLLPSNVSSSELRGEGYAWRRGVEDEGQVPEVGNSGNKMSSARRCIRG